jgi:hypothetical protein
MDQATTSEEGEMKFSGRWCRRWGGWSAGDEWKSCLRWTDEYNRNIPDVCKWPFENTRRTTVALAIEAMNSDGDFVTKYVNGKVEMHPLAKMKVILKKSTRDSKRYRQEMLVWKIRLRYCSSKYG